VVTAEPIFRSVSPLGRQPCQSTRLAGLSVCLSVSGSVSFMLAIIHTGAITKNNYHKNKRKQNAKHLSPPKKAPDVVAPKLVGRSRRPS